MTEAGDREAEASDLPQGPPTGSGEAAGLAAVGVAAPEEKEGQDEAGDEGGRAPARPPRRSRRVGWAPRVVASAALVLLAVSWLPPYLSHRAENAALAASGDGDAVTALAHARRAAGLDPLAVSPLLTEASMLQQLGRNREALERLQEASRLQPQNYEVWYAMGVLEHRAFEHDKAARAAFRRALGLNPLDAASRYEFEQALR